jgi:hypothetical protein
MDSCTTFSYQTGLTHKNIMAPLIRFKIVQIDSIISFDGKKKKKLHYLVRSLSLVPTTETPENPPGFMSIPEIFWQ